MSHTTSDFYNRISSVYDAIADGGEHKARELGLRLLDVKEGESVLEVGFGTGHSLVALANSVGDSGHVDGIDIAAGMKSVALTRIEDVGLQSRVTLRVGEVPPLPYDDGHFDSVAMSFTLELFSLSTIPAVLSEVRRVLVPNGRLGVVSMAAVGDGDSESILEKVYKWTHRHFPHIVDCQPIDLERHLRDAGFDIDQHERIEIFTMPVAAIVGRNRKGVS